MENRCRFCGGKTMLVDRKLMHASESDDDHKAAASPSGFVSEEACERAMFEHELGI